MTLKKSLAWMSVLLPALPVMLVLYSNYLPSSLRSQTVSLAGEWKAQEATGEPKALPEVSEEGWKTVRLPGTMRGQGVGAGAVWLRKWVELPNNLGNEDLVLVLGDSRSGVVRAFVNGHFVGDQGVVSAGAKTSLNGLVAWTVPRHLIHPGRNLVALYADFMTPVYDGITDSRLYLGPDGLLKPHILNVITIEDFLLYGPPFFFVFVSAALLSFLIREWGGELKRRYLATLGLVLASTLYLVLKSGIGVWGLVDISVRVKLIPVPILLIVGFFQEFYEEWSFRRVTLLGKINRICLVLVTALALLLPLKSLFILYQINIPVMLGLLFWIAVVNVKSLVQKQSTFNPILLSQSLIAFTTWLLDLLTDLNVLQAPRFAPFVMANIGVTATIVVMGDFFRISADNKNLVSSLGIANKELGQALVAAKESARLKGEFFANVSHELRTPLNSIINVPEGLLSDFLQPPWAKCSVCQSCFQLGPDEPVDPATPCPGCEQTGTLELQTERQYVGVPDETVRFLQIIQRNGRHLLSVVNQILDASKLEAGRMEIEPEEVSIKDVLENVESAIQPIAAARGITLAFPSPLPDFPLYADPVKVTQLLINLVGNAVRFSPEKETVGFELKDEGTTFVMKVQDRGIGIAKEHHALIFESFRQVEGGSTRKFGGTGLGLAIAKKLVMLHGGDIWVESDLGKGSTFFVRLHKRTQLDQKTPHDQVPIASQKVIVVVDDDSIGLETIRLALRSKPYQIVGVTDSREAARTISQLEPSLVVLDVMMPYKNGMTVLDEIRADPKVSRIPILVLSAYHDRKQWAVQMGAHWMGKPWTQNALAAEIEQMLAGSEAGRLNEGLKEL